MIQVIGNKEYQLLWYNADTCAMFLVGKQDQSPQWSMHLTDHQHYISRAVTGQVATPQ